MKTKVMLGVLGMLLSATVAQAAPVLVIGTPGDALLATPSKPSPNLGGTFLNFDGLTPFSTFSPTTYTASNGVTISSPDGLVVYPYSTQSGPNYLYDNSAAGSANIDITLTKGTDAIGVGIADSDVTASGAAVTIMLQALNSSDVGFGSVFDVTIPENTVNPGNGYFVLDDTSFDIYGLQIVQPVSNANYSGLAIDDVQVQPTPEPPSFALLATGMIALFAIGSSRMLKRA